MSSMKQDWNWVAMILVICFTILAMSSTIDGAQYWFKDSRYSYNENGVTSATVMLERSMSADPVSIAISSDCPTECPLPSGLTQATHGDTGDWDYTFTSPVSYDAGQNAAPVSITINDDNMEEMRNIFAWRWRMKMNGEVNDCVETFTPNLGPPSYTLSYDPTDAATARYGYVGPWSTTTADPLTVQVTPESGGSGDDTNIFLTTSPNYQSFNYYGIYLDDSLATDASGGHGASGSAALDTIIVKDAVTGEFANAGGENYVTAGATDNFELSYAESTGEISLTPSDSSKTAISESENAPGLQIQYLFLSAGGGEFASWKICGAGLDPKVIPIQCVSASGYVDPYKPFKVMDKDRDPHGRGFPCFVSDEDDDGNHWIQLDLGREFEVQKVVIFPLQSDISSVADMADLSNANVRVGSCRHDDIAKNTDCDSVPSVANLGAIEVDCGNSITKEVYGRYVHIISTGSKPLPICEVYVYGDDVPINKETSVSFLLGPKQTVTEDGESVELTITRTGTGSTCTYLDYSIDFGNAGFSDISITSPQEIKMDSDTSKITIPITNDDICEDTESFNVTLDNIVGGYLGSQCWICVEITDDDSVTYSMVSTSRSVSEKDGGLFIPVQRTGTGVMQQGTATLTFRDISATSNDYGNTRQTLIFPPSTPSSPNTQTAYVNIVDNNCYEDSETFTADISSVGPAQCSFIGTGPSVQITITDDDSELKWVVESDNIIIKEGESPIQLEMTRKGTVQAKTVAFYVDHITTDNEDISVPSNYGEVTFIAGSASSTQPVTVPIQDDNEVEEDETFTLTLVDPLGSACPNENRGEPYKLYIQIRDNDAKYYWKEPTLTVGESEGQVSVCLVRTGDISTARTVAISFDSVTAYSGIDFLPLRNIIFDTESEICVPVTIFDNDNIESAKTFTISIEPRQDNIVVGSPGVVTVTITDDDSEIGWEQEFYTFVEGSSASVMIQKVGDKAVSFTVTSTSGLYTRLSQSIYISASDDSYSLLLSIPDDNIPEADRIFTLTLTEPSSGMITQGTTTIAITDNDLHIATTTQSSASDNRGIGGGGIVGITIAGIIAIITIIGAIVFVLYICRRSVAAGGAVATNGSGSQSPPLGYAEGSAYYVY
ncbi:uncharacterized protein [Amphiura filiformis]|uniref:uncharacterized protein n=1 Tax=Amphiura filiformis TaxID=82378 RepID=UPI003B217029